METIALAVIIGRDALPMVAALVGSILAVTFRRRLGRGATWCAALGFGFLVADRAGNILIWVDRSDLLYLSAPLLLTDLAAAPLLVFAVFLGRRARQAPTVDEGSFTVGSEQPFDIQPFH